MCFGDEGGWWWWCWEKGEKTLQQLTISRCFVSTQNNVVRSVVVQTTVWNLYFSASFRKTYAALRRVLAWWFSCVFTPSGMAVLSMSVQHFLGGLITTLTFTTMMHCTQRAEESIQVKTDFIHTCQDPDCCYLTIWLSLSFFFVLTVSLFGVRSSPVA